MLNPSSLWGVKKNIVSEKDFGSKRNFGFAKNSRSKAIIWGQPSYAKIKQAVTGNVQINPGYKKVNP